MSEGKATWASLVIFSHSFPQGRTVKNKAIEIDWCELLGNSIIFLAKDTFTVIKKYMKRQMKGTKSRKRKDKMQDK